MELLVSETISSYLRFSSLRIYSKKKCIFCLFFYIICIVFFCSFYMNKLGSNKNENCTVQSIDILEKERKYSKYLNIYLKNFFNNTHLDNLKKPSKWVLLATDIYGYSAFLEKCPSVLSLQHCIKFIAIVSSNFSSAVPFTSNLKCAIKNNSFYKGHFAIIEILPESHNKNFTAAFIFCPVWKDIYPTYASVYETSSNITWLHVENYKALENISVSGSGFSVIESPQGISLCVRPFYGDFDFLKFFQFLIYYSAMGIDHFIFYYTDSFKPLQTFLSFMKFNNFSNEIHRWNMLLDNDLVHEYGQIAFTQDCLIRSRQRFKYTVIIDVDEYIVPKVHKDIKSLVSYLDAHYKFAGSYVIQNTFFCYEYLNEESSIFPLFILNYKKRQKSTWMHHYRSKYILMPHRVQYAGVHFIWKFEDNYKEVYISPDIALLNHYRFCCGLKQTWFFHLLEFNVLDDTVVTDNSMTKFRDKFLNHHLLNFINNLLSDEFVIT